MSPPARPTAFGPDIAAYFDRRREVSGWFASEDFRLFDWLLARQPPGDLLEIGAYQGASAILIGLHRRGSETFTVCDLFGLAEEDVNRVESERYYSDLTRAGFERNYLTFLGELPTIVAQDSRNILEHVRPGTCRFVHVDGCHLYDYVRADIASSRRLLDAGGILVCDDWRTLHTPGVTAAVMEEVVTGALHPIAITESKLYGTWDERSAAGLRSAVVAWAAQERDVGLELEHIRGVPWPRIVPPPAPRHSLPRRGAAWLRHALGARLRSG